MVGSRRFRVIDAFLIIMMILPIRGYCDFGSSRLFYNTDAKMGFTDYRIAGKFVARNDFGFGAVSVFNARALSEGRYKAPAFGRIYRE